MKTLALLRPRNAALALAAALLASPAHAGRITENGSVPGAFGVAVSRNGEIFVPNGAYISDFRPSGFANYPVAGATLIRIAAGPDAVWAVDTDANVIHRVRYLTGQTAYPIPTANSQPRGIVVGPDGNIWFTEYHGNQIGRLTPDGVFTEFPIPTPGGNPDGITNADDGNLWFLELGAGKLGRITPTGVITEYPMPNPDTNPRGIASTGYTIAITEGSGNKIAFFSIAIQQFEGEAPVPTLGSFPLDVVVGPDGAFWFTEYFGNKIGRVDFPSYAITEYPIPTPVSGPYGLAFAKDGRLWFVEHDAGKVAILSPNVAGDANGDGNVDVSDVFYVINFLFGGGPAPK
jgi:streptogramin lyase